MEHSLCQLCNFLLHYVGFLYNYNISFAREKLKIIIIIGVSRHDSRMEEKTLRWKAEGWREDIDIPVLKTQTDTAIVGGTAVWGRPIQCSDPVGRFVFF